MIKKRSIIFFVIVIVIALSTLLLYFFKDNIEQQWNNSNLSMLVENFSNEFPISLTYNREDAGVSYPQGTVLPPSYSVSDVSFIRFTRDDGMFSFEYPETWEYVRNTMGTLKFRVKTRPEAGNSFFILSRQLDPQLFNADIAGYKPVDYKEFDFKGFRAARFRQEANEYIDEFFYIQKENTLIKSIFRSYSNFQNQTPNIIDLRDQMPLVEKVFESIELLF